METNDICHLFLQGLSPSSWQIPQAGTKLICSLYLLSLSSFAGLQMPSLLSSPWMCPSLSPYIFPLSTILPSFPQLRFCKALLSIPFSYLLLPSVLAYGINLCCFNKLFRIPIDVCMEKPNQLDAVDVNAANYWSFKICAVFCFSYQQVTINRFLSLSFPKTGDIKSITLISHLWCIRWIFYQVASTSKHFVTEFN